MCVSTHISSWWLWDQNDSNVTYALLLGDELFLKCKSNRAWIYLSGVIFSKHSWERFMQQKKEINVRCTREKKSISYLYIFPNNCVAQMANNIDINNASTYRPRDIRIFIQFSLSSRIRGTRPELAAAGTTEVKWRLHPLYLIAAFRP